MIRQSLLFSCLLLPLISCAQLVLQLNNLPASTPTVDDIYVAGNFNDWQPGNTDYILTANAEGTRTISLDLAPDTYEFKFTRGTWPTVEGTADGGFRPNRSIVYSGGLQQVPLDIAGWEGLAGSNSTAAANVELLAESFYLPQLDRNRKIWIYLPPDYYASNHRYPVMYMHDGQNLFDANTSFSGEWEVDESLNTLFEQGDDGIIIVGINNGGGNRLAEYTPWANPNYGGGEGSEYVDFLVQTLKPYVDQNYRSQSDQPNTGVMGSSLGGLISLYAGIRHQEVFGKIGALSPSFWFTDDIYDFVAATGKQQELRIAMTGGSEESSSMVSDLEAMYTALRNIGFEEDALSLAIHPDGQHSEWYWRREFPATYQWLFQDVTFVEGTAGLQNLQLRPNPAQQELTIEGLPAAGTPWEAIIYDSLGRTMQRSTLSGQKLELTDFSAGSYILVVFNQQEQWATLRFQRM